MGEGGEVCCAQQECGRGEAEGSWDRHGALRRRPSFRWPHTYIHNGILPTVPELFKASAQLCSPRCSVFHQAFCLKWRMKRQSMMVKAAAPCYAKLRPATHPRRE